MKQFMVVVTIVITAILINISLNSVKIEKLEESQLKTLEHISQLQEITLELHKIKRDFMSSIELAKKNRG